MAAKKSANESLQKAQAEAAEAVKSQQVCPHCGYCPHCGRAHPVGVKPYPMPYPMPYPVPAPRPIYPRPYGPYWGNNAVRGTSANQSTSLGDQTMVVN